jgi:predicted CXXCH cytochrome family protein
VQCHDPHASPFEANLRERGNALCTGCHQELAGAASLAHPHRPVAQDCLGCHDAHASKRAGHLLVQRSPELCLSCHATDRPSAVRGHVGYPVDRADCTSCHDPHGSPNEGILWASVHAPVGRRMCSQCHLEPASPTALDLKRAGADLCRGCHSELFDASRGKDHVHWPFVDGRGCESCHRPHASGTPKLLAAPEGELCGSCHADVVRRQERSATKHPPVEAGACSTCHEPHAADTAFLLVGANDFELCGTCHDWEKHSAHPIGDKVLDQRNRNLTLDCASCHRTHGSPHEHLTHFEHRMELCVQCHANLAR